mgnify:CR=1 FL=1
MAEQKQSPASAGTVCEAQDKYSSGHNSIERPFPLYASVKDSRPAKFVSLAELGVMASSPTIRPKGQAQALTPFHAQGKQNPNAETALFYALAQDHDDDDQSYAEIADRYNGYGRAFLAFTTSSHLQEKHGITAQRWKVIIPFSRPVDFERYHRISSGLALMLGTDAVQQRKAQVFYAPNKISEAAPYDFIDATDHPELDPLDDADPLVSACLAAYQAEEERKAVIERKAIPKPRSVSGEHAGIIGKVNAAYRLTELLASTGYRQQGKRYLSPWSSTGTPGVSILERDGKQVAYSHHGESDPLSNLNHDGHALDVFDVITALEYGGDVAKAVAELAPMVDPEGQRRRQREYMQAEGLNPAVKQPHALLAEPVISRSATRLAKTIRERVLEALEVDEGSEWEPKLTPDTSVIDAMINGAFWSGSQGKVFMLNHQQSLNRYTERDAYKFLRMTFGAVIDKAAVAARANEMDFGDPATMAAQQRREKHIALVVGIPGGLLLDHLKFHNQRDSIEWRVDMFATQPRLELLEDKARIVLTHRPYEVSSPRNPKVVADFKEHFTRLDDFIKFLVMSRFSADRKKCYLWIHADSDWGKGFLLGVLQKLNAAVGTSMREIEAMFEGRPVGRTPEEFKRALALVVDEFKTVKAELKQLQSEITLAPKHQLTARVEIFAKIFLSAESVGSLVTENGVEDQFANRMSVFIESGTLEERSLFNEVGKGRYLAGVAGYVADEMNRMVSEMQAMGKEGSQAAADEWINGFIKQYGLDTVFDRFSASLPRVAMDVSDWLMSVDSGLKSHILRDQRTGQSYLTSAAKRVDVYLEEHFDRSEIGAYRKRKPEILKHMSADGCGVKSHRVNGKVEKCILLKSP